MRETEAQDLIRDAIAGTHPQNWADLGCGSGVFTLALKSLLPAGSRLTAVDKVPQRLPVNFVLADFETDELPLNRLDGILMANSIHYVADKEKLIKKLEGYFQEGPAFVIVEYESNRASRWVPYPMPTESLYPLFKKLGYDSVAILATHPSRFGSDMYAALVKRAKDLHEV
jgi:ubiquinone/menaquinone biosynthesis C-methylase UbiE